MNFSLQQRLKNGFITITNQFALSEKDEKCVFESDGVRVHIERTKTHLSLFRTMQKPPTEVGGPFLISCYKAVLRLKLNKTCYLVDFTKAENMSVKESLILTVDYAVGTKVCSLNLVCAVFVNAFD